MILLEFQMTQNEFATALIALLTIVIAILSFFGQWISSINTWKLADDANRKSDRANEIANNALNISLRDHKINIRPKPLAIYDYVIAFPFLPEDDYIPITIVNPSPTTIEVTMIELHSKFEFTEEPSLPKKLKHNNYKTYYLKYRGNIRSSAVNLAKTKLHQQGQPINKESLEDSTIFDALFQQSIEADMKRTSILIDFKDEINTEYTVRLLWNNNESKFIGEPSEV